MSVNERGWKPWPSPDGSCPDEHHRAHHDKETELSVENVRLRAQNAKLIEALRPFASLVQYDGRLSGALMADVYRHAARVLKEIEDEVVDWARGTD